MIIKRMTAYFGALEGRSLELGPGLNILYAPNESGKSTWCAFLRAMLYGVDTGQRAKQGQQPDKKKYQPWSGAPMSGSMDVETASGPVTLRRWTERAGQPMQAFSATVTGTDVPAGIAAGEAGQTLTGAPREVFERSAFICQAGLGVTPDPELEKRFAAIVSAGDEEQSFSETDKKLRAWLRRRRSGRRGAIPETEAAIAQARSELGRIAEGTRAVEQLERELDQLQVRQEELVRRMEKARAEARRKALSDLAAARAAVLAAESDRRAAEDEKTRAVEALRQTAFGAMGPEQAKERALSDADEAESLARQAGTLPPAWTAFLPLILAAAGLGLWLGGVMGWAWCLALGAAGIAGTVGAWLWLRRAGERRDALLARRTEILEDYGVREPRELDGLLEEYERLWAEAKAAARTLGRAEEALESARRTQKAAEEPVLNGLDFINGDSEAARASRAVTQGREEMERLRERRAIAEGRARAMGDPMALESELTALEERRDALLDQEAALTLAAEAMEQADLTLRERFSPMLAQEAAALFGKLTGGRYDEITLARDLSAKARLAGDAVGREADYLSQGARDQLYLALRLAVCALVLPAEQACPIILDDALTAFDRERMGRALDLMKELAKERQVLLFTCHEREGAYFAGDDAVTKIELGA